MSGTQKTMMRTAMLFAATLLALVVFSGVALAATVTCQAEVNCFGTKRADTLNGGEGRDLMHGKGRGDTLNGFGSFDYLYGEGGADKLFGGPNVDTLTGGPGNDALSGGEDTDYYDFYSGWGKDSITDSTATSQNVVHFVGFVDEDLTIKLVSGDGPEVKNASATSTISWEENAIGNVTSGAGDDQITGNSAPNDIDASSGADTIFSGAGDDTIHVDDGAPDDVVDCGENGFITDNDTVYYDPGDEVTNCEVHNP